MKKIITFLILLSFLIGNNQVLAIKNDSQIAQSLIVLGNDGVSIVSGSVLNPKQDEINIFLSRTVANKIRKTGLDKLSVTLTSAFDSTKTYLVPSDAASIQKKVLNKKSGKYLVLSLFNLANLSGVTTPPSALPSDNYKLKITGGDLDIATDTFTYQTPALIVGTVDSESPGLVSVEDLSGGTISERTVATNPSGTFFTEVRANKIGANGKTRTYLKGQTTQTEKIDTGIVHAVTTDSDLKAIVPLDNNVDNNAAKVDKPVQVNEASTLTANLAKENPGLATEVGKEQLQDLASADSNSGNSNPSSAASFNDSSCNVNQFADSCKESKTEDNLAAIGANFKSFLQTASCTFQDFDLIKKTILATPDSANVFIGKGYCEHLSTEVDSNKPCQIYAQILKKHQSGEDKSLLPCPPPGCTEFANITQDSKDSSKRCFEPKGFCDDSKSSLGQCIQKPRKELYCARIGTDIKPEECRDDEASQFKSGWVIETNSKGNQYCIPTNFLQPPSGLTSSKDIAEQCEINACHKACHEKLGNKPLLLPSVSGVISQKCEECDCHLACDAGAGKATDCGNPKSKGFSNKCCNRSSSARATLSGQFLPPGYGNNIGAGTKGAKGSVAKDVKGCLCGQQIKNVDENGFFTEDAINICSHICPSGYEESKNNADQCVSLCPIGLVRDSTGNCVKNKCPAGTTQDDSGNCKCPEGQTLTQSGTCEIVCPEGQKKDPGTGQCVKENKCSEDQHADSSGICKCNSDGSVPGPDGCKKQNQCSSNMLPNPQANEPNQAKCICPVTLPYWDGEKCVSVCVVGNAPPITNTDLPLNSPIPCGLVGASICDAAQSTKKDKCICAGAATPDKDTGICKCPSGKIYSQTGCDVPRNCEAEQFSVKDACTCASPGFLNTMTGKCDCPQGYTATYSAQGCGTLITQICASGQASTSSSPCKCAGIATQSSDTKICKCPEGKTYTVNGCADHVCALGEASSSTNLCACAIGASFNSQKKCTCPTGQTYTINGCADHICGVEEISTTTNLCACPTGASLDSQNKCACPSGQTYSTTGCTPTCTGGKTLDQATNTCKCQNNQVDTNGTCGCQTGFQVDPANQNNCVACTACTGGKTFSGTGCTCACPQGKTEVSGQCQ